MRTFSCLKMLLPSVAVSSGSAAYDALERPLTVPTCHKQCNNQRGWLIAHDYTEFSGYIVFLYETTCCVVLVNSNCWLKGIERTNKLNLSSNISISTILPSVVAQSCCKERQKDASDQLFSRHHLSCAKRQTHRRQAYCCWCFSTMHSCFGAIWRRYYYFIMYYEHTRV